MRAIRRLYFETVPGLPKLANPLALLYFQTRTKVQHINSMRDYSIVVAPNAGNGLRAGILEGM